MVDGDCAYPLRASRRTILAGGAAALALAPFSATLAATAAHGPVPSPDPDAPDAPAVRISNGIATAVLYLPDTKVGYYRATRFDWSGHVADLQVNGHSYFGRWFPAYDPMKHDAVVGPAQDWATPQGLDAAPVGGTFVKIGVGVLRKPAEMPRGFPTLEIVDHGKWTTNVRPDAVEFIHEVADSASGYAYRLVKVVSLPAGKAELLITQRMESMGANPIDAQMYNHNFFVFDQQPSGPDVEVTFPFVLEPFNMRGDAVQVVGNKIVYLKPVEGSVRMQIKGFSDAPSDYTIRLENKRTGAGVLVTSDKPLSDLVFWSSPRTTCPEPYIRVRADKGQPMDWMTRYQFYSLKPT